MPKSGHKGKKPDSCALDREILHAMHDENWLAPETEEAVKRAEARLEGEKITIPTSFEHPRDLLRHGGKIRIIRRSDRNAQSDEAREDLARAAREGGTITPEIEERMKADRDRAESKKKR
jgi:hypothetical protein